MSLVVTAIILISAQLIECSKTCWKCQDANRWSDCIDWDQISCEGDQTMCGFVYTRQTSLENYRRDCFTQDFCDNKPLCKAQGLTNCQIECCNTDNCNSGSPSFGNARISAPPLSFTLLIIAMSLLKLFTYFIF